MELVQILHSASLREASWRRVIHAGLSLISNVYPFCRRFGPTLTWHPSSLRPLVRPGQLAMGLGLRCQPWGVGRGCGCPYATSLDCWPRKTWATGSSASCPPSRFWIKQKHKNIIIGRNMEVIVNWTLKTANINYCCKQLKNCRQRFDNVRFPLLKNLFDRWNFKKQKKKLCCVKNIRCIKAPKYYLQKFIWRVLGWMNCWKCCW